MKNIRALIVVSLVISWLGWGTLSASFRTAAAHQAPRIRIVEAQRDEIASGVIVLENARELRLKISPCDDRSDIVVFAAPFVKTKITPVRCGAQTVERYQVQRK